ncbi:MAG: CHAD domain-containing protein, partial [Ideonella sp.]
LAAAAAELFRDLGVARDRSVLAGPLSASIECALRQAGDDGSLTLPGSRNTEADIVAWIRSTTAQQLLLGLIDATLPARVETLHTGDSGSLIANVPRSRAESAKPSSLRRLLAQRLRRWQRTVSRDADRFAELDEAARHRLRKHVKRLRYAVEIARGLVGKRHAASISKPLKQAQRVLGDLNDLSNAIQAFGDGAGDHRVWFARGWLIARREALLARSGKPMQRLARATHKNRLR